MSCTCALVLTAQPLADALNDSALAVVHVLLAGRNVLQENWLAEREAWQAMFLAHAQDEVAALRSAIAAAIDTRPIDVNIIDVAHRRKHLLITDMDSTIIQQECIDEMADLLGLKTTIAAITERAMRGELDFEAALTERLALLKGITESELARVYHDRITLTPGAKTLIATMKANGAFTVLVSGGFTFFTRRVAERAGFDANHANQLEITDGKMTGKAISPILGREAKLRTLERYTKKLGLDPMLTLAVGDGANDLAMIRAAGLGVAYRAKPIVASQAAASISHANLEALLYLQGYRRAEFAGGLTSAM
jgi:phosphoserine phosphatase